MEKKGEKKEQEKGTQVHSRLANIRESVFQKQWMLWFWSMRTFRGRGTDW